MGADVVLGAIAAKLCMFWIPLYLLAPHRKQPSENMYIYMVFAYPVVFLWVVSL